MVNDDGSSEMSLASPLSLFCNSHSCHTGSGSSHTESGKITRGSVWLLISPPVHSLLEIAARLIPKTLSPYQSLGQNIQWLFYWLQDEVQIPQPSIQGPPMLGSTGSFQTYLLSIPSSATTGLLTVSRTILPLFLLLLHFECIPSLLNLFKPYPFPNTQLRFHLLLEAWPDLRELKSFFFLNSESTFVWISGF